MDEKHVRNCNSREAGVKVLIVEARAPLARLWQRHLERSGASVFLASGQDAAVEWLTCEQLDMIVLNVMLRDGSALAVSDVAQFRQPSARIIFVTDSTFFSDGSIFTLCANACAYVPSGTRPDDLTSMVHHYAQMENAS